MSKENQNKKYDGQNRCRRCDRPLSDPNDIYGWRCAQIVGFDTYQKMVSTLDEEALKIYNAYVTKYLGDSSRSRTTANTKATKQEHFLPTTSRKDAAAIITNNATAIKDAGAYYGVNPAIIAACIFTEQIRLV